MRVLTPGKRQHTGGAATVGRCHTAEPAMRTL
jgi:hypothetical protein